MVTLDIIISLNIRISLATVIYLIHIFYFCECYFFHARTYMYICVTESQWEQIDGEHVYVSLLNLLKKAHSAVTYDFDILLGHYASVIYRTCAINFIT